MALIVVALKACGRCIDDRLFRIFVSGNDFAGIITDDLRDASRKYDVEICVDDLQCITDRGIQFLHATENNVFFVDTGARENIRGKVSGASCGFRKFLRAAGTTVKDRESTVDRLNGLHRTQCAFISLLI